MKQLLMRCGQSQTSLNACDTSTVASRAALLNAFAPGARRTNFQTECALATVT